MNVTFIKEGESRQTSLPYESWMRDYVNKGLAHKCKIVSYPDLAILNILLNNIFIVRREITELLDAKNKKTSNPNEFSFNRINKQELIKHHLRRSSMVSLRDSFSFINPAKYVFSSILFFLSIIHFERKKTQRNNWLIIAIIVIAGIIAAVSAAFGIYAVYKQYIKP